MKRLYKGWRYTEGLGQLKIKMVTALKIRINVIVRVTITMIRVTSRDYDKNYLHIGIIIMVTMRIIIRAITES